MEHRALFPQIAKRLGQPSAAFGSWGKLLISDLRSPVVSSQLSGSPAFAVIPSRGDDEGPLLSSSITQATHRLLPNSLSRSCFPPLTDHLSPITMFPLSAPR